MKDLKARLLMTLVCVFFLVLLIGFAPYIYFAPIFTAFVAGVSSIALYEYLQIVKRKGIIPFTKLAIIAGVIYTFAIFITIHFPSLELIPFLVLGLLLTFLFLMHFQNTESALTSIATTFFGIIYIVVPFACILYVMYGFPEAKSSSGRIWLTYLLVVTKMTDVGGLFIGRFFGKKLLIPKISPKKTVAGAVGGILFAVITSTAFAFATHFEEGSYLDLSLTESIFLGLILGVFAEVGDLAESLLKRDGKVKDSNARLPGLGGALDTIDSILFTTPLLCLFLRIQSL